MRKKEDLIGRKFNLLTVVSEGEPNKKNQTRVVCKCDCGSSKEVLVRPSDLKNNGTRSCGCYWKKRNKEAHTFHGMTKSKTHNAWKAMKSRCNNSNNLNFYNYGGRGIGYDPAWETFENFLADMGEAPKGLSLDRIDTNGNYCKENCRWATTKEQCQNQRHTVLNPKLASYIKGYYLKGGNMARLSRELGIAMTTLSKCARGLTWKNIEPDLTI